MSRLKGVFEELQNKKALLFPLLTFVNTCRGILGYCLVQGILQRKLTKPCGCSECL